MTKLRVATVITRFNGGAGLVALNGALALDPDTYERTVVTGGIGMDSKAAEADTAAGTADEVLTGEAAVANAAAGDLTPQAHAAGMEIVQVRTLVPQISPRDDMRALRTLTRVLHEGGYDVVHTHSAKGGVIGRVAAARAGVPRIVHTWHGFPFNEFQSWPRRRAYIALERVAAKHTDAFLAIGSETVTTALRLGLATPERIRLSWPAVRVETFTSRFTNGEGTRARARRRLDLPLGVKVVGSIGRLTFQKGPEILADAIARLPDDVFGIWVGGGSMAAELAARTRKLGIEERMRWLGHRDDVADILPAFDVMAMPSRWEGLPCVLVEAISTGVPLVATAVPSNQDLVQAGETGLLVPPEDPERLAGALAYLLDNPAEAARMAGRARERLGDGFSSEFLATVLDETYRGLSRRPYQRQP